MKKILLTLLLMLGANLSVQAQDVCQYWFGTSCENVGDLSSSQFTVYRDYFSKQSTIVPWRQSANKDQGNPGPSPDTALGIQVLQKPRLVLWVQPVSRVWGFKLFFDF